MEKEGGLRRNWRKRTFKLDYSGKLSYYENVDEPPKGVIDVTNDGQRTEIDTELTNGFKLITPKRIWRFKCKDESDRDSWIYSINQAIKGRMYDYTVDGARLINTC